MVYFVYHFKQQMPLPTKNLGSRLVNTLPLIRQPGSMALIGADW